MFISDTENHKRYIGRIAAAYAVISVFCMLFGIIYECFSHGIYSAFMIYAFAFPLLGGALPFSVMKLFVKRLPGLLPVNLYNSGIAALTVGSMLQGALDIYGTTNSLIKVYWISGFGFLIIGIMLYLAGVFLSCMKSKRS